MRSNNLFFSLVLVLFFMPMTVALSADDSPVYELRVYTCEPGKLEALHSRFRNHTMKIFEKHGIKNIAYWTPTEGDKASNTLVYLLEHKSRAAADESWMGFRNDAEWKAVAAKYISVVIVLIPAVVVYIRNIRKVSLAKIALAFPLTILCCYHRNYDAVLLIPQRPDNDWGV